MVKKMYSADIEIPEGINVDISNNVIKVKGAKGELERSFVNPRIVINKVDNKIKIKPNESIKFSKPDKMFINTYRSHIRNLLIGVSDGYTAKLKICSGHFPMNVSVEGGRISIKNFLGEKIPRKTAILGSVKVQVQGDEIIVIGIDKENVGQMAARIEQLTRITNRDRRIFQDGCYIVQKPGE